MLCRGPKRRLAAERGARLGRVEGLIVPTCTTISPGEQPLIASLHPLHSSMESLKPFQVWDAFQQCFQGCSSLAVFSTGHSCAFLLLIHRRLSTIDLPRCARPLPWCQLLLPDSSSIHVRRLIADWWLRRSISDCWLKGMSPSLHCPRASLGNLVRSAWVHLA